MPAGFAGQRPGNCTVLNGGESKAIFFVPEITLLRLRFSPEADERETKRRPKCSFRRHNEQIVSGSPTSRIDYLVVPDKCTLFY